MMRRPNDLGASRFFVFGFFVVAVIVVIVAMMFVGSEPDCRGTTRVYHEQRYVGRDADGYSIYDYDSYAVPNDPTCMTGER